jgi:serine protease AprX
MKRTPLRTILTVAAIALAFTLSLRGAAQPHRAHLSDDLLRHEARGSSERVRTILRGSAAEVEAVARRHGLRIVKRLAGGAVVGVSSQELKRLAADPLVAHLSGDPIVTPAMAISNRSTAADQTWKGTWGLLGIGSVPGVIGQGIGVAVVDSGISKHKALGAKVVASVSFVTGDPSDEDAYGHGTHVAGIIGGLPGKTSSEVYTGGVAPGVHLINVRVLGANGSGYTSDVIDGIDWVIENRAKYNIRVMNLSLGHPVMEPASTDPLCQAVMRAVRAGIVVVAAAGNAGRSADGSPILGGITSPGNSPYAITVGALNTAGTVQREDDTVASYSSRGPTKYDLAVKPDLAAPGSRIVSLEADGSYLSENHPALHRAGWGDNAYMYLSGTSMATPITSGAVALLLEGTPGLSPGHVKLALQSGARYVEDGGLMGAGAGSLNIWASRRIAGSGLTALATSLLNTLIGGAATASSGASFWDEGTLSERLYDGIGTRLLSGLDLSRVWVNPGLLRVGDLNLVGLLNPLAFVPANNLIWGEVAQWEQGQHIIWGTSNDHIIWGTSDHIIWGTEMRDPDGQHVIWGTSGDDHIIWGTDTLTSSDPE